MALDNKVVLNSLTWHVTGTVNIPGTDFEEKDTYTLKITIADDLGNKAEYIYEVTNALGHYPALAISGEYNEPPAPHSMFYVATVGQAAAPFIVLRNITSNISFNLTSSSGDTTIYDATLYGDDIKNITIQKTPGTSPWLNQASTSVNIEADFPLFLGEHDTYSDASVEIDTYEYDATIQGTYLSEVALAGDYSNVPLAINNFSTEDTIPQDKIYFIRDVLKKNGSVVEHKHYKFKIPPNGKLWLLAEEHDSTGQSYNMTLRAKGLGLPPSFLWQVGGSGTSWTLGHVLTPTLSKYYYGEWTDYGTGDWYKVANLNTNIPIFTSEEQGEMYEDGKLGEDAAINSGDLGYDGKITTGDALDSSDIPSPVIAGSGAGVNVWLLDKGNLNAIFADLYSDTQTIIDDIKKGTWQWGNNPIDFIISIYYVPFDVSNFYDTRTERLYLGHYDTQHDYTQCKETKSSGQRMILVNTTIDSVYGDWRDLDFFKYELFLPYVGFVPLDSQIYVGHQLKVELAFDVMTHNIRYYLFSDGTVVDRIDGSVGYAIPITGTDMVNKASQNLNGLMNLVKAGSDIGMGAAQMSKGALTTGFSNVTDGVMGTIGGMKNMAQYPKQIIKGNISASMNIFDINYVYLKITEKQSIYPNAIRSVYNNPSYVCCSLSELSGYCELADVQLVSSCTEREYNEILQLLKEGVIF